MSKVWRAAVLLALSLLVGTLLAPAAMAAPAFQWSSPRPQGELLTAIAYGDGQFVAVGQGGAILTSTDGATWKHRPFWVTGALHGVAYGAGRFVAVGAGGLVATSVDGATWVKADAGTRAHLHAVTYTGERFVAVGATGMLLTSADGLQWQEQRTGTHFDLYAVTYGNGRYIAAGAMGMVITSLDAAAWSRLAVPTAWDLHGAAYGGGRFALVGEKGTILTSTDGSTFKLDGARADDLKAVAHGGDRFVAAGAQLSVSVVDAPWTIYRTLPINAASQVHALAYGAGQFVGVGTRGMIYRSANGTDWTAVVPVTSGEYTALAYGNGQYIVAGSAGMLSSADGLTWTQRSTLDFSAAAFGGGIFAAVGDRAYRSYDGITWTESAAPGFRPAAMVYGVGRFVAVGTLVAISHDGYNWSTQNGPGERLVQMAAGYDRLLAIAQSGATYTSMDGLSWQKGFHPVNEVAGIAFGAGRFLMADRTGQVYTSTDAMTWTMQPRLQARVGQVAYAGGRFLAMAEGGALYQSTDGQSWTRLASGATAELRAAVDGPGRVVALAAGGGILMHMGDFAMAPCGGRFMDVAVTYPACESVHRLADRSVVTGYPDGSFRPEQTITRAEFAKLLVLTMGRQPQPGAALPFSDLAGHWAASQGYLQTAYQMGAIGGFPDGRFLPDAPLSRSQAVKMAAVAAAMGSSSATGYADITAGAWYSGYLGGAQLRGLVGTGARAPLWDGPVFREATLVTRAEAVMLLDNLLR